MKLLFDQNLSRRFVSRLATAFPDSAHVTEFGLDEATDEQIWAHAGTHGFVVATKDSDFRQLAFLHGPPPKVVWLRVGNVSTDAIHELLAASLDVIETFAGSEQEALLILEGDRPRVND